MVGCPSWLFRETSSVKLAKERVGKRSVIHNHNLTPCATRHSNIHTLALFGQASQAVFFAL